MLKVQYTADGCTGTTTVKFEVFTYAYFMALMGALVLFLFVSSFFGVVALVVLAVYTVTNLVRPIHFKVRRGVLFLDGVQVPLRGAEIQLTRTSIVIHRVLGEPASIGFQPRTDLDVAEALFESLRKVQQTLAGTSAEVPAALEGLRD